MLKAIKENKGGALPMVLILLLVITILVTSVIHLNSNNIKQARLQEEGVRAYYIAASGVELAYGALVMDNASLLEAFKTNSNHVLEETGVALGDGTVDIKVSTFNKKGELWIRIISTGRIDNSVVNAATTLEFNVNNPSQINRSK